MLTLTFQAENYGVEVSSWLPDTQLMYQSKLEVQKGKYPININIIDNLMPNSRWSHDYKASFNCTNSMHLFKAPFKGHYEFTLKKTGYNPTIEYLILLEDLSLNVTLNDNEREPVHTMSLQTYRMNDYNWYGDTIIRLIDFDQTWKLTLNSSDVVGIRVPFFENAQITSEDRMTFSVTLISKLE